MRSDLPLTFITPKEAARLLGVSPRTLEKHRAMGRGLPFWQPRAPDGTPIGRPRYALQDVLEARDAAENKPLMHANPALPAAPRGPARDPSGT